MANCATEPAGAEAVPDALDDVALAALSDAALDELAELLAKLPDAALDEDDACDEPQLQSPSANMAASTTTANTFLLMIEFLSPGALQTPLPFSGITGYATVNVPSS